MKTRKPKKVVVRISGGLGNQMFRHAAALALARQTGRELCYDLSDFLVFHGRAYQMREFAGPSRVPHWNLALSALYLAAYIVYKRLWPRAFPALLRALRVRRFGEASPWVPEPSFFDPAVRASAQTLYVDGNCQHLSYLPDEQTLREAFAFERPPCERNRALLDRLQREETVSVHVRRSDYLTLSNSVLGFPYYIRAVELVRDSVARPQWVVFSDDIPWCRGQFGFLEGAVFVEGNDAEPWEDLRLMAACRHHIIANSTFSWWGACLGRDPGGVTVAPEHWFSGLPTSSCLLKEGWLTAPSHLLP
jgi:hypothetical protein